MTTPTGSSGSTGTSGSAGTSGTHELRTAVKVDILDTDSHLEPLTLSGSRDAAQKRAPSSRPRRALIVVDIQNDFASPSGSLVVPKYSTVIENVNRILRHCFAKSASATQCPYYERVVFTKDWHPADHWSFMGNGPEHRTSWEARSLWPPHCVQGTPGADLSSALDLSLPYAVTYKGKLSNVESYSAFGTAHESTKLYSWLVTHGITHVDVAGLAADFCVRATAEDAATLGFSTTIIYDATVPIKEAEWEAYMRREKTLDFISTAELLNRHCTTPSHSAPHHCAPQTKTPHGCSIFTPHIKDVV